MMAFLLFFAGLASFKSLAQSSPREEADVLIQGGHLVDGTDGPQTLANVALKGDRIIYVGRAPIKAKRLIDATGKVVTPGLFDMHSHSEFGLSFDGRGLSKITQGVTTEVTLGGAGTGARCGRSYDGDASDCAKLDNTGRLLIVLQKKGIGLNVVSYVGAG
jgi:N-acyl-D-aspartate/D-glutamate deacylase